MRISTKELFKILPNKFSICYTINSGIMKSEQDKTLIRLKNILSNEYKYICPIITDWKNNKIYTDVSETFGGDLIWDVSNV